ncbi:MAG: hypothetical protein AW07_01053 [Candidatus Accumulibacter sp. SK-11]|nr:MAG: hypothetical protein AW07_01053 [Candidatus Accumulibacter sp. SK-11]
MTAIELFRAPAVAPVTVTVIAPLTAVLSVPARMPLRAPLPLIWLLPEAPKEALRSSTKPAAPLAVLRTTRLWLTCWPTCRVPKFSGPVCSEPAASW